MKLIFFRHGQTDFNKNKVVQGQEMDPPLNETGIQQVEAAVPSLPADIDFILSSPLKRASLTAEILNRRLGKRLELSDELKELSYGSLAGKAWTEIEIITGDRDVHQKERDTLFDYRPYGGNSAEDLKKRVVRFVSGLKDEYREKTILVATHGGVIGAMHTLFPQKEKEEIHNAAIHEFLF